MPNSKQHTFNKLAYTPLYEGVRLCTMAVRFWYNTLSKSSLYTHVFDGFRHYSFIYLNAIDNPLKILLYMAKSKKQPAHDSKMDQNHNRSSHPSISNVESAPGTSQGEGSVSEVNYNESNERNEDDTDTISQPKGMDA